MPVLACVMNRSRSQASGGKGEAKRDCPGASAPVRRHPGGGMGTGPMVVWPRAVINDKQCGGQVSKLGTSAAAQHTCAARGWVSVGPGQRMRERLPTACGSASGLPRLLYMCALLSRAGRLVGGGAQALRAAVRDAHAPPVDAVLHAAADAAGQRLQVRHPAHAAAAAAARRRAARRAAGCRAWGAAAPQQRRLRLAHHKALLPHRRLQVDLRQAGGWHSGSSRGGPGVLRMRSRGAAVTHVLFSQRPKPRKICSSWGAARRSTAPNRPPPTRVSRAAISRSTSRCLRAR